MAEEKITVLHLCEHFGGAEASLHGVSKAFQWWIPCFNSERFRILLCSRKGYDKAAEQMKKSGIDPLYLGCGKTDPRNLTRLIKIIRLEKVDIIHAHGFGACMWARIAGKMLNKPVIVHGRANYGEVPASMQLIERTLGPGTKHAFAVSESTKNFMASMRHIPKENITVLYNGILLDRIEKVSEEWIKDFRKENGATPETKIIGIVGRLAGHKGHKDAFKTLKQVLSSEPNTCIWVLGDGDYLTELEKFVSENNLKDNVKFLGFRRDAIKIIQCFDIQLFPSYMEGTPNTLFEAMAVGNCIVANHTDGQGEILEDEVTALMYDAGDIDAMTSQLLRAMKDKTISDKLEESALTKSSYFDGKKCVATMEATYERIMAQ